MSAEGGCWREPQSPRKASNQTFAFSGPNPSRPTTRISRCEPAIASRYRRPTPIADGLRPPKPGAITFPIVQEHVEDILLVTEQEIRDAVAFIQSRMKLVVEPSGAVAPATAFAHKIPGRVRRVGLIVSGGNV